MSQFFTKLSEKAAELAGHYLAFVLASLFIIIWGVTGPCLTSQTRGNLW